MKPRARAAVLVVLALMALAGWWAVDRRGAGSAVTRTPSADPAAPAAEGRASVALLSPDSLLDAERVAVPAGGAGDVELGSETATADAVAAVEAPPAALLRGRATFGHGGPAAEVRLSAVEPSAESVSPGGARPRPYGTASTDADGRFEMKIDGAGVARGAARLLLEHWAPWKSDLRVHPIDGETEARVVLEGGQLGVRVVGIDGKPAPDVKLRVAFSSDGPRAEPRVAKPWTDDAGRALAPYVGAGAMEVRAVTPDGSSGAGPIVVRVDDRVVPSDVELTLTAEARAGRIAVEVVDRAGAPVEHFAVVVDDGEDFERRYVHSEELGPGRCIEGLPIGRARVVLQWRNRAPRNLYPEKAYEPVWVQLVADAEPSLVRFEVELRSGIVFELRRPSGAKPDLRVRARATADTSAAWQPMRDLWEYHEDGSATCGVDFRENGTYYTSERAPGWLALEFHDGRDGPVLARKDVELHAGAVTIVLVDF